MAVYDKLANFKSFKTVVVALHNQTVKLATRASILYVDVIVVTVDGWRENFVELAAGVAQVDLIVVAINDQAPCVPLSKMDYSVVMV